MESARCDRTTLAEIYESGAETYRDVWSPIIIPPARRLISRLDLRGATVVLDVGAGVGALTPLLRSAAPQAGIVSMDPSLAMLQSIPAGEISVAVQGDAMALPFGTECADAVILSYVLFHLPDPGGGLREARRVLRSDGLLGTVTWGEEQPLRAADVWSEVLDVHSIPTLPAGSNHEGLDSVDAMTSTLRDAGLARVDAWIEMVEYDFDPDEYFRFRSGFGINRARLETVEESRRLEVLAEVRHRLDLLDSDAYAYRAQAICAVSSPSADR
ncbi:MAG TPA: class I SAM-dependent methyltransferase [Acidimicrobiales bacterium]|jgi:SAM-dependent methyltransferase|nr:class I SAM-dependent methyltransferase [Acidimicrobiales bacterium]